MIPMTIPGKQKNNKEEEDETSHKLTKHIRLMIRLKAARKSWEKTV